MWSFVLYFLTIGQPFFDVILNFVEYIRIGLNATLMIINIAFLALARPRRFTNHVKIGLGRLFEFFVFFEWVFFKTIRAPTKKFKHVWVFSSVFSCFSKYLFGKIYFVGVLLLYFFIGRSLHLEILIQIRFIAKNIKSL